MRVLTYLIFILIIGACESTNYEKLPLYSEKGNMQAVIEIPAGTNTKIEYHYELHRFVPDSINGKARVVHYLPYPANYGFLPSTKMDISEGGDGDALDVLVLCPTLNTSTIIEIIPIAAFDMIDNGERDTKVIAIPADPDLHTINAQSLTELTENYPGVKEIIETWFLNYKHGKNIQINGWLSSDEAINIILQSQL